MARPRRCARRTSRPSSSPERTALRSGPADRPSRCASRWNRGWHIYWQNPGDSGLPTTIAWKLPPGVDRRADPVAGAARAAGRSAGQLRLRGRGAAPRRPQGAAAGGHRAAGRPSKARADWLVCKETCIPEGVDLDADAAGGRRRRRPTRRWGGADRGDAARRCRGRSPAGRRAREGDGPTIALTLVPPPGAARSGRAALLPATPSARSSPRRRRRSTRDGDAYRADAAGRERPRRPACRGLPACSPRPAVARRRRRGGDASTSPLAGSVVAGAEARAGRGTDAQPRAAARRRRPTSALVARRRCSRCWAGVLLNLMPCVFPVLSIKVLGFATHHDSPATLRREAVAFAAGVVLTFVALGARRSSRCARPASSWAGASSCSRRRSVTALARALLRAGAEPVRACSSSASSRRRASPGWTAQQPQRSTPSLRACSPSSSPRRARRRSWARRSGYALTGSAAVTLLVFVALGVGHGAAVRAAGVVPRVARAGCRRRARGSARFKQLLAFPLYATVIWLVWVLGAQLDNDARAAPAAWRCWRRASRCGRGGSCATAARGRRGDRRRRRARGGAVVAWPLCRRREARRARDVRRRRGAARSGDWHRVLAGAASPSSPAAGRAGVRRLHRGVVRHLPGQQAAGAQRRRRARGLRAQATSRWCAPTGPAAIPRSPRRWPRWAATACPSTCCTGPARNRCCCRRSCNGRRCSTRWRTL